ncbi:uncharacterized protein LOC108679788 [Hyalella azteca]|uniref:Uncharacterized protein LOC108679788 n=1 Tax=Hyalella azteca TaxID=294128 RepID=A0A8B7PEH2_HYAAZ|nr:uncharacterized protein LOC108679788 [Hyalella azteca]
MLDIYFSQIPFPVRPTRLKDETCSRSNSCSSSSSSAASPVQQPSCPHFYEPHSGLATLSNLPPLALTEPLKKRPPAVLVTDNLKKRRLEPIQDLRNLTRPIPQALGSLPRPIPLDLRGSSGRAAVPESSVWKRTQNSDKPNEPTPAMNQLSERLVSSIMDEVNAQVPVASTGTYAAHHTDAPTSATASPGPRQASRVDNCAAKSVHEASIACTPKRVRDARTNKEDGSVYAREQTCVQLALVQGAALRSVSCLLHAPDFAETILVPRVRQGSADSSAKDDCNEKKDDSEGQAIVGESVRAAVRELVKDLAFAATVASPYEKPVEMLWVQRCHSLLHSTSVQAAAEESCSISEAQHSVLVLASAEGLVTPAPGAASKESCERPKSLLLDAAGEDPRSRSHSSSPRPPAHRPTHPLLHSASEGTSSSMAPGMSPASSSLLLSASEAPLDTLRNLTYRRFLRRLGAAQAAGIIDPEHDDYSFLLSDAVSSAGAYRDTGHRTSYDSAVVLASSSTPLTSSNSAPAAANASVSSSLATTVSSAPQHNSTSGRGLTTSMRGHSTIGRGRTTRGAGCTFGELTIALASCEEGRDTTSGEGRFTSGGDLATGSGGQGTCGGSHDTSGGHGTCGGSHGTSVGQVTCGSHGTSGSQATCGGSHGTSGGQGTCGGSHGTSGGQAASGGGGSLTVQSSLLPLLFEMGFSLRHIQAAFAANTINKVEATGRHMNQLVTWLLENPMPSHPHQALLPPYPPQALLPPTCPSERRRSNDDALTLFANQVSDTSRDTSDTSWRRRAFVRRTGLSLIHI